MDDHTSPTPDPAPTAAIEPSTPSSPAASAPARSGFTLRGRRWAYGATLAAAGVLAGGGVTYAVVSATAPTSVVASQADQAGQVGPGNGTARGGRGPMGAPPEGAVPEGAAPDGTAPQGQAPDAQPSTGSSAGTTQPT